MSSAIEASFVVAAIDLELRTDEVLVHAQRHASHLRATLAVVHVAAHADGIDALTLDLQARIQRVTGLAQDQFQAVVLVGDVVASIVAFTSQHSTALLVMGAHQRSTVLERIVGTVISRLADQTSCPVLVVRPPYGLRVMVATDLSSTAEPTIAAGVAEARRRGVPLTVVHCIDAEVAPNADAGACADATAQIAATLAPYAIDAEVCVWSGNPPEVVLRAVFGTAADLVVLAKRSQLMLERIISPSTFDRLLDEAPCSVLLVPR